MGGKHKAYGDKRDMFPSTVEVVRILRPKSFIIENVKGLTRPSFANYYQYILLQLEFPEITRRNHESWLDHLKRLQAEKASGVHPALGLTAFHKDANASSLWASAPILVSNGHPHNQLPAWTLCCIPSG